MSIRELFSSNLRELCVERGTLARITRETGVGRVQLNRYLNGTIPNDANLAELARFFDIEEEEFFQRSKPLTPDCFGEAERFVKPLVRQISEEPTARLEEGAYFFYFQMPEQTQLVMKCATFIRRVGNFTTYRSYTREVMTTDSTISGFKSVKRGLVLERYGQFYFLGMSLRGSREPAMVVASWLHISIPLLSGRAVVMHSTQAKSLQFIAHKVSSDMTTRQILKDCGIRKISELENGDLFTRLLASQDAKIQSSAPLAASA